MLISIVFRMWFGGRDRHIEYDLNLGFDLSYKKLLAGTLTRRGFGSVSEVKTNKLR